MKRLATICARGGSRGVKNKNIRPLGGKPLIAHTIEQVFQSGLFSTLAVSSDNPKILKIAEEWGVEHLINRPPEMATDMAAKLPAIRHCSQTVEKRTGEVYDTFVDLDASSPLRNIDDICGAVSFVERDGVDTVITGTQARRSPYFNLVEVNDNGSVYLSKQLEKRIVRRQDSPKCYDMNASIYAWTRKALLFGENNLFGAATRLFVMPEERSVDIDNELDFKFVEYLFKNQEAEK